MTHKSIGFIGGGNMAKSLIGGLIQSGVPASQIVVSEPLRNSREDLIKRFGIEVFEANGEVASRADILVLAVKPQVMRTAIDSIASFLRSRDVLFISIAAGITIKSLERWLGGEPSIVRVMPNTPALIGAGISALFANPNVSDVGRDDAERILQAVGKTVWLTKEKLLDAVTAVSGSGPAYYFYMMEALQNAAITEGLDAATARLLTIETALGASRLALASKESVTTLREQVTSPGGTTEAALNIMQSEKMAESYGKAVAAARRRADELSRELGSSDEEVQ